MKALSPDLRERIVKAYLNGEGSQKHIAQRFSVSQRTVRRLVKLYRSTGSLLPRTRFNGRSPILGPQDRQWLLQLFKENPDLTQEQLAHRLTEAGRPVSQQTVSRALKRLGITRKKRP
ncbi:helix-turn-helix domain-containing protein [Rhodocaloribacter litoris]|uniref:helix-turn-helix domain-containing protein n=1 Tax=Rhodocaloribacter litoris TaxID=2558931 RepID=UPI0014220029|nr:helix-turn-helix domain-containing protein [Rhodocaloribacter litoris]QXD13704.1 helix-turn-helix domain-containing protein [Rhodocaloribacter litoris]QXD13855.1 helix-turn-helix domain-containing protein [Rhodocaloribacter litoris]QXD16195.1 helix-turn-helix domain-containing protein [Rhodocaloribacter litoris]QXD16676.1 helix-turn-helix domain-containing protein [Rhodocaloribacter litoris]QXD16885.1 helix-turn-helix domain-containing protein [Rhodocaloribacter litoris]